MCVGVGVGVRRMRAADRRPRDDPQTPRPLHHAAGAARQVRG